MYAIILSLVAAVAYGISGPFIKAGCHRGMLSDGFLISYSIGMALVFLPALSSKGLAGVYPNWPAAMYGILAGIFATIGCKTSAMAIAVPSSSASVVLVLMGMYPLVSALIGLWWLEEYKNLAVTPFSIGAVMIVAGAILVSTSIKQ